jgi:hypothetical protein
MREKCQGLTVFNCVIAFTTKLFPSSSGSTLARSGGPAGALAQRATGRHTLLHMIDRFVASGPSRPKCTQEVLMLQYDAASISRPSA